MPTAVSPKCTFGFEQLDAGHRSHPLYSAPGAPATSDRNMKTPPACGVCTRSASERFSRSDVMYTVRLSGPPKHGIVGWVIGSSMYLMRSPAGLKRLIRPREMPQLQ